MWPSVAKYAWECSFQFRVIRGHAALTPMRTVREVACPTQHPPTTSMAMVASSAMDIPVLLAPRSAASAPAEPYQYLFNTTHPAQAGTERTVEALMAVVRRSTEAFHPELALGDPFFIALWEVRRPIECTLELRSSVFCSSRHRYRSSSGSLLV